MAAATTDTIPSSTTRLDAEALFDSIGPKYEDAFSTCTEQHNSISWLLSRLPPTSSVLDIGCGTGRPTCSMLSEAGHSVHGIDVSSAMISAARTNVPSATFTKADIKTFQPDPPGHQYDAITVYFSLIASMTKSGIRDVFVNIHSWLKPGGYFIFATVPISGDNLEIEWMARPIVVSSLNKEESLDGIKNAGFEVLDVRESIFMPTAAEVGICKKEDVWEEPHLFIFARK